MSTIHHYKSNLRDIFFNLFEFNRIGDETLGKGRFTVMDEETVRDALRALEELATNELSKSFASADREGLRLEDDGTVVLPEGLKKSLQAYADQGWNRLELPAHLGGYEAPPSVVWAAFEMIVGANPPAGFYLFGNFIARVIDELGTDSQRERFCQAIVDNFWGGSMVLTEPDAGSDVGSARAKARHVEGDVWEIEGTKRFITNGDFDFTDNIVHLVLARPEGAKPGTKGLSLFIVPKYWVDENGEPGERNGVYVTKIEKKMGLKASSTCEMVFGEDKPARGLLMGDVHNGIRQMFQVIEHARMGVGVKSMSTLSTAYLNSLDYARERIQGPDLERARDKKAPRVEIIRHPDVRRMLMLQKSFAEGMRALCMYTGFIQDQVELQGGHGADDARELDRLNDLLLPLVKGYCSEKAYALLATSLQVFGGSGYIKDFPIEQYIRDAKIDTLYEGTTHIQALDLFFRKVARDMGETLRGLLGRIRSTIEEEEGGDALIDERAALAQALEDVESIFGAMMGKVGESIYHAGLQGNRILFALAELVIGWLLVRQAAVALERRAENPADRSFYDGKVAAAGFFCSEILPGISLSRQLVENSSLELMEIPDEVF